MNKKTLSPVETKGDESLSLDAEDETKAYPLEAINTDEEPIAEVIDEHKTPTPEIVDDLIEPISEKTDAYREPTPERSYDSISSLHETADEPSTQSHDRVNEHCASSPMVVNAHKTPRLDVINERIQKLEYYNAKLDSHLEHGKILPEDYTNKKREVLKRLKPLKRLQASVEIDNELADSDINLRQDNSFKEKFINRTKRRIEKKEDDGSATRLSRLAAYLIDMLILTPFTAFYAWGAFNILNSSGIISFMSNGMQLYIYIIISLGGMCFNWTIYVAMNAYWLNKYGQTIGKRVMKIYIADVNNTEEKAEFIDILLKRIGFIAFIPLIPTIGGLIALIDCLLIFTANKRCLHDVVAKTKVMKIRDDYSKK